jgi:hypothetical protein
MANSLKKLMTTKEAFKNIENIAHIHKVGRYRVYRMFIFYRNKNIQCCGSGMFIPDPGSDFFPSRIQDPGSQLFTSRIPYPRSASKNLSVSTPKNGF